MYKIKGTYGNTPVDITISVSADAIIGLLREVSARYPEIEEILKSFLGTPELWPTPEPRAKKRSAHARK